MQCGPCTMSCDDLWSSCMVLLLLQMCAYSKQIAVTSSTLFQIHNSGMNYGLQDSFNLGWKLAMVVKGTAKPHLLDSYGEERRPFAQMILQSGEASEKATTMKCPNQRAARDKMLRSVFASVLGTRKKATVSHLPRNSVLSSALLPNFARRSASGQNFQTTSLRLRTDEAPQPPLPTPSRSGFTNQPEPIR